LLNNLTPEQQLKIKGPVVDIDNRFNKVFPSFNPFNKEFVLGYCLIDVFSSHFSFYITSQSNKYLNVHIQALDNIALTSSLDSSMTLVVVNASIKNQVTTSISHVHVYNKQIIKMIHHTVNVTTTEAELFAIRCSINQAINLQSIRKIIVIMDSIHSTRKIFNYSLHPFQVHIVLISNKLRRFFDAYNSNTINFWKCSS